MSGSTALTPQIFERLLTDYRDDRVLQIDRACSHYFSELDNLAGNVDFSSQLFNIGGDYITVLMGLAGSPAKHLAILAGGQAAFNQTVDATRALLLLNPAPSAVRTLVNASQRRLLQTAEADKAVTHAKVERLVQAYALACTPIGIRAIVNEAVTERALVEDPDRTGPAAQAALAELTTLLNAGQGPDTQISALDAGAAAHLLWVMDTPNCNSEACEAYKRSKERYPALVAAYDRLADKTAVRAKLTQITAVEASIGVRRATLQNDLINESKDREKAALLERTKELENDLSNLRTRLSTAENLATSRQTEIKRLEATASQIVSGSQGVTVGPVPEGR